jgi:pimeloyl-ACP methyl ester carboxylesterase
MAQQPMSNQATIICLHSSGSSGGQWSALRAQLEPDVQVLTPDLHGHGAGPAWHGFDEDVVAADAARVARFAATVAGEIHLVGHSYGGVIATALYHREGGVAVYEPVVFRLFITTAGPPGLGRKRAPPIAAITLAGAAAARRYWGGAVHGTLSVTSKRHLKRIGVITAQFAAPPARCPPRTVRCAPVLMLRAKHAPIRRIGGSCALRTNATFDTIPAIVYGSILTREAVARRITSSYRNMRSCRPRCAARGLTGFLKVGEPEKSPLTLHCGIIPVPQSMVREFGQ